MKLTRNKFLKSLVVIAGFTAVFGSAERAHGQIAITGQVKDSETKENLAYCKVVALDAKDSIVRGGITDDKGFFRLPLEPGMYKFVTSFYGYTNDTIKADIYRKDGFLGVIKLVAEMVDFEEVRIEGSANIVTLDKDVTIITETLKTGATATKDVLHKIPGISYDDYSGTLKVDNDATIMILVNGVEKSQEYVQNLDPERLLRVETIRDPGGRYGLEGYSAILNVILKSDYKGTEFYVEQMQLVDIDTERSKVQLLIIGINGTYNYTKDNLNLYLSANTGRRRFEITSVSRTDYNDNLVVLERANGIDPNGIILEYEADYTLGFDYRINPKHLISFESQISALPLSTSDNLFEYQTEVYSNDSLIDQYHFSQRTKSRTLNTHTSFFYIGDFNERNKLNMNFTYSYYNSDYSANTLQEANYMRDEIGVNNKQYTRFYAEYDHIFSKKSNFQVGYGNTWRQLKNDFAIDQLDLPSGIEVSASNTFKLSDTRHELYSNYSHKFGAKWSTKIGLAAEVSSPRATGLNVNYLIYQPMFDLAYTPGQKLNLKLKYRTASAYPSIEEINPFVSLINPRLTQTGNPFLKPATIHEFSIRMNAFQGLLSIEPYTHYSNTMVAQVGEMDVNNIFNFRFENVELYQRSGGKLNFSKYFKFSLLAQANLEVYHAKIVSTSGTNSLTDWRAEADLIYIFPKSEALVGLKYQRNQSKQISGLGYDKGDVDFWMLLYKQPLFKKKASIMFGYFLPLDLGANYNQDSQVTATGLNMHYDNDVSLVKNMFILEFTYRFSKGKSVKQTEKHVDQETEKEAGGMF